MDANLDYLDVKAYLDSRGIPYDVEGKNVQKGWIGVRCLWCDDHSNHLGIDLQTKGINCFRCPIKGTVIKLIMKVEGCSFSSALRLVQKYSYIRYRTDERTLGREQMPKSPDRVKLPLLSDTRLLKNHHDYLLSRNFDPFEVFEKYKLRCCGPAGNFRMRLIIPFYEKGRMVTFTSRDVTGLSKVPYVHCSEERSILHPKNTLYNIDSVGDTAIIVEGVFDVFRLGDGAVATMGDKWTKRQLVLLKKLKRAFLLFDTEEEAQENAENLAKSLSITVPDVHRLELGEGDPADISPEDAAAIRREIFGRVY